MRLAWITDPHIDPEITTPDAESVFLESIRTATADAFVVTGDFAEALAVQEVIGRIRAAAARPVYFVLGNHDFYGGTIGDVRFRVSRLCRAHKDELVYLSDCGPISLTERTALIGHDGWGDGRVGVWRDTNVKLQDPIRIGDLIQARALGGRFGVIDRLNQLGDEAARHLRDNLRSAFASHDAVIVATHVPPFWEAAWHNGGLSDDDWAPFFVCEAVGRVLLEAAEARPDRDVLVLCGHTHSEGFVQIRPNLAVRTGGARYGCPEIQDILEIA